MKTYFILVGSFFCAISLLLDAGNAHMFNAFLNQYQQSLITLSTKFMFYHGIALFLAILIKMHVNISNKIHYFFTLGTMLFSGSLLAIVLFNEKKFGMITPFGGIMLIITWILLGYNVTKKTTS